MTRRDDPRTAAARVFAEGGPFGELLSGIDWAATPLGPPVSWPGPLVDTLRLMLTSDHGMALYWGAEFATLYNLGSTPIVGAKHPWALGRPYKEVFPEVWAHPVSSHFHYVTDTRKPLLVPDELLIMERHGFLEQCYFDSAFQPVLLDDGTAGGVLQILTETTGRVLGERRLRLLSETGTRTAGLPTPGEVARVVAEVAGSYPDEIPFLGMYLASEPGMQRPAASTGLRSAPETVSLNAADGPAAAMLAQVVDNGAPATLPAAAFTGGSMAGQHAAASRLPVEQALALPLHCAGQVEGVLVVGVNPCFPPAGAYHDFLEVLASAVAGALSAALAHEEQRRRAEALAELDRAKTTFFANVSHEFRTPLTLLLGPLQQALADEDRPERREQLELAERGALRLLKQVNTLLDVARAEAGQTRPALEPVDLAGATAELAGVFRSAFEAAGLTLDVDCPPLPKPVPLDREMWEKVILNLLSNALKFTFTGGAQVQVAAASDWARLTVTDTGTGIPADELPRLFERFHRVRGARSRSHEGSGLGLVLVKDLVEAHGGTVGVDSRLGQGTTLTVDLPFATAQRPRPAPPEADAGSPGEIPREGGGGRPGRRAAYVDEALGWLAADPVPAAATSAAPAPHAPATHDALHGPSPHESDRPHRARLLVVDDNADMRAYLTQLLQPDYDVLLAADGRAALEMALAQPVEMVLSDVMMPRMDGFELVRALRADPRTARLPIVLLTARAGEEESVQGRHAGADDYLAKPFSARQLLARVRTGLELSRLREQALTETRNQLAVLASLADAGLRLSATLDPDQILQTAGQILLPDFADQISIHLTPAAPAPAQSPPPYIAGTPLLAREALATAATRAINGTAPASVGPHQAPAAVLALPLHAHDQTLGALVLVRHTGGYSAVEHKYLENLAHRLALAYDNATRYHNERRLALTLQRALLPHRLPQLPGVRLATHYRASNRGAEVGGDWYDVLALPDGAVGLAIGDVMGHDVEAATLMGQLRSALHSLALEGAGPAQVLTRLDAYLQSLATDRFATCLYAVYDPNQHRLRYAASGHLPPLLVAADTAYLELPPALPLGLGSTPVDREVAFPPGTSLLLYTDGLVENRALSLDDGLAALRRTCAALPAAARSDPQRITERALELLNTPDRVDDDAALLAATAEPSRGTGAPQTDRSAIQPTATTRSRC
ncbi:SpoIIE family protein phosphatase [Streptomyces doebereineriae]|uniref:histidine kinase n=1 Tax=Streptomyces doebereineriae TaxID=3075528 RepID=A0ABU2V659_9ACTN|nr:SpoIIE family protein phosphatase [Streptomyces sp. DSM 41640]MDT0481043.1 SpoIIE family protein phosphatase [Streptomyces sp. DSM 41640]